MSYRKPICAAKRGSLHYITFIAAEIWSPFHDSAIFFEENLIPATKGPENTKNIKKSYKISENQSEIEKSLPKWPPSGKISSRLDDSARFFEENPIPATRGPKSTKKYRN